MTEEGHKEKVEDAKNVLLNKRQFLPNKHQFQLPGLGGIPGNEKLLIVLIYLIQG